MRQTLVHEGIPKLLVIEDDEFLSGIIKETAEALGYQVDCVYDGTHVATQLLSFKPDITFLDLVLPGFDGVELLEVFRTSNYLGKLVVMSGVDQRTLKSVANSAKSNGLDLISTLAKPFTADQVKSILQSLKSTLAQQSKSESKSEGKAETSQLSYGPQLMLYPIFPINEKDNNPSAKRLYIELVWQLDEGALVSFEKVVIQNQADQMKLGKLDTLLEKIGRGDLGPYASDNSLNYQIPMDISLLDNRDLPALLGEMLSSKGISPNRIMFDFPETLLRSNDQKAHNVLSRLKLAGLSTSISLVKEISEIDDTLTRLNRVAVDMITLDMSYKLNSPQVLSDLESEFQFSSLVTSAQRSGLTVGVAGVDSIPQLEFARRCKFAEGRGTVFNRLA